MNKFHEISIPNSGRKKALMVIDVQPRFLNDRMSYIVSNIEQLIKNYSYSLYVEALFFAEENSIWKKQSNWFSPKADNLLTIEPLGSTLRNLSAIQVIKSTRSVFKGEPKILETLRQDNIEEIHFVGLDTYDCITASIHEAQDLNFFAYIIEECCQATTSQELHERAVANLRQTKLTNNSCIESIPFVKINLSA